MDPPPLSSKEISREPRAVWDKHSQHLLWSRACKAKRLDEGRQGRNLSDGDTRDHKSVTKTKNRMNTSGDKSYNQPALSKTVSKHE